MEAKRALEHKVEGASQVNESLKDAPAPRTVVPGNYTIELEHAIAFNGRVASSLVAHPNQKDYLAIAGGTIAICNLNDSHQQEFLRGHTARIRSVAVSPSGKYVASAQEGDEPDVIVWDFQSRRQLYRLSEHYQGVEAIAFSHDDRFLVTVGTDAYRRVYIWDMNSGYIVGNNSIPASASAVAWGGRAKDVKGRPTTHFVLASCHPRTQQILMWDLDPATGEITFEAAKTGAHKRNYTCLAFSPDHDLVFAGSDSGDITAFHVRNKVLQHVIPACQKGVHAVAVTKSLDVIVGGGDGSVSWFRSNGKEYAEQRRIQLSGDICSISLSADQSEIIVGTASGDAYRVNNANGQSLLFAQSHTAQVKCLGMQRGASDKFATCSADGELRVWDAADYNVIAKARLPSEPTAVVCADDAIVVGLKDGSIRGYNPISGQPLWEVVNAHKDGVSSLALARNQRFVVSAGVNGELRVWELRSRQLVCSLKEHLQPVTGLVMFDDNFHIISCSQDRSFLCWDLQAEKRVSGHRQRMGGINAVALSGDQSVILTGGQERSVSMWDLRDSKPIAVLSPAHDGEVTAIAVSSNGKIFATGGTDHVVKLWDYETRQIIAEGVGHSGTINALQFTADDNQLVSVGDDDAVLVWNVYSL